MSKIRAFAVFAVLAVFVMALPVSAQVPGVRLTCSNLVIDNAVEIVLNLRPGTYTVTALGIGGFDPMMGVVITDTNNVIECVDDSPAAASYSANLPTTGNVAASSLNSQITFTHSGSGFVDYSVVVGGFGGRNGEFLLIVENMAVTADDGSGDGAGDPFSVYTSQNLLASGVPITAYMLAVDAALDPLVYIWNADRQVVATIDGERVYCDDAGNPSLCWGDSVSLNEFSVTVRNNRQVQGDGFDAMLSIPVAIVNPNQWLNFHFTSFNQVSFGDYIAAFHMGIDSAESGLVGPVGPIPTPAVTPEPSAPSAVIALACNDTAQGIVGPAGTTVTVSCPADCTSGSIWGTDVYTDDSTVCRAAQHAGVIGAQGGTFNVTILDGQSVYTGSPRNGIESMSWGSWDRSFSISVAAGQAAQPSSGTIEFGQTVRGNLVSGREDNITFRASAGDRVTIDMISNEFDTYLILIGPDGVQVTSDDDSGDGFNARIENFLLPQSGIYTIVARGWSLEASGAYELTLVRGGTAQPLPQQPQQPAGSMLSYGTTVTGNLPSGGRDIYTFLGTTNDVITIDMISAEFDTFLELIGPNGFEVARDDDSGQGLNARIENFALPTTGTYTIIARGFAGASGAYTLTLSRGSGTSTTITPAGGSIEYGQTLRGVLSPNARDSYTFVGTAGDLVTIDLISNDFDTYLELIGPNGIEVARDDDSGQNLNARIENFTLPSTGTYTIIARAFSSGFGSYDLTLVQVGAASPATSISYGQSLTDVLTAGGRNSYTFDGTAGDVITIDMVSTDFDTFLELLGPNGAEVTRDDDSGDGFNARIANFTLPTTGTYTIIARAFGAGFGSYTLTLVAGGSGETSK
ncbi:MAG: pre-peptidase C-terminal domain-containing protein [Aggregatilineales bacterium]